MAEGLVSSEVRSAVPESFYDLFAHIMPSILLLGALVLIFVPVTKLESVLNLNASVLWIGAIVLLVLCDVHGQCAASLANTFIKRWIVAGLVLLLRVRNAFPLYHEYYFLRWGLLPSHVREELEEIVRIEDSIVNAHHGYPQARATEAIPRKESTPAEDQGFHLYRKEEVHLYDDYRRKREVSEPATAGGEAEQPAGSADGSPTTEGGDSKARLGGRTFLAKIKQACSQRWRKWWRKRTRPLRNWTRLWREWTHTSMGIRHHELLLAYFRQNAPELVPFLLKKYARVKVARAMAFNALCLTLVLLVAGVINLISSTELIYMRPDWWWCFPIVLFTLLIFCYAFFRRQAWYGEVLVVSAYRVPRKKSASASGSADGPGVPDKC